MKIIYLFAFEPPPLALIGYVVIMSAIILLIAEWGKITKNFKLFFKKKM
ncbi:MAG TPA: hypothetical protein VLB02_01715 [Candidatus Paceibacterota bacterium]|nr:hypothetical protein [Candidatus Paceibacterota bacterium]